MSYICKIVTAVPANKINQEERADFMADLVEADEELKKKINILYKRSGIKHRHSVIPDFTIQHLLNLEPENRIASTQERMKSYEEFAPVLALDAISKLNLTQPELNDITHVITISCTGMLAPGIDIWLVEQLQLKSTTHRTSINFMGCYAALHGLKQADAICNSMPNAKVLLVSVELCTLHFQKDSSNDHIAANLLFSDGAAAAIIGSNPENGSLKINGFYSQLLSSGKNEMAWRIGNNGFIMTLSGYIPQLLGSNIVAIVNQACLSFGLNLKNIDKFAVHPGGRKILDEISKQLSLDIKLISESYDVLKQYGNMSSPTILFILESIMKQNLSEKILAMAFGPGLTVETVYLSKVN